MIRQYLYRVNLVMLFLGGFSISIVAQCERSEHLEPVSGVFDDFDHSIEYDLKLREYFLSELPERYELRYIVKPSFEYEYVFQINRIENSDNLKVILLIGGNSIWNDVVSRKPYEENPYSEKGKVGFDKDNPPPIPKDKFKIKRYEASLSTQDFHVIKDLMDIVILQTKYTPPTGLIGTDGTTHFFSVSLDWYKSGQIWSPKEGSKMDRLIKIFEEMCKRTKRKRTLKINGELENQIQELKVDISK